VAVDVPAWSPSTPHNLMLLLLPLAKGMTGAAAPCIVGFAPAEATSGTDCQVDIGGGRRREARSPLAGGGWAKPLSFCGRGGSRMGGWRCICADASTKLLGSPVYSARRRYFPVAAEMRTAFWPDFTSWVEAGSAALAT
jgi:hypothetical protein